MLPPYADDAARVERRVNSAKGGTSLEDNRFEPAEAAAPRRRRWNRWLLVGGVVPVLALVLGVGMLLGTVFGGGLAQAASDANQGQTFSFAQGTPGPGNQGPCVTLTVTSVSGSTILAKASDGSTVTIHTTSSTTYTKNHQAASASAITAGARISVMGTKNSDGSITATSIDVLG
jgi:hypothetical protein